jgi:hypothetical protein
MLHKKFANTKMFDLAMIVILRHQEMEVPSGQSHFIPITKLLVAQKFINIWNLKLHIIF